MTTDLPPKPAPRWPSWAREEYEERAAIYEYDAGLPRREAEGRAKAELLGLMKRRAAVAVIAGFASMTIAGCSTDDTVVRIGVGYDHREGTVEGSQQFWPAASARIDESPVYRGWVEFEFPWGPASTKRIEIENWSEIALASRSDNVPTIVHSSPAPAPVVTEREKPTPKQQEATIELFGMKLPSSVATLGLVIVLALVVVPLAVVMVRNLPSKRGGGGGAE